MKLGRNDSLTIFVMLALSVIAASGAAAIFFYIAALFIDQATLG